MGMWRNVVEEAYGRPLTEDEWTEINKNPKSVERIEKIQGGLDRTGKKMMSTGLMMTLVITIPLLLLLILLF